MMLLGNGVDVFLTQSTISRMLSSLFPVKEASKLPPHGSESLCGVNWTITML